MHIEFEGLVKAKIPAFQGREERNNRLILETLAVQGPLIKYDVFKALRPKGVRHYPTISRRVDDLKARNYLGSSGKRLIMLGKRTEESPTYTLTWRGFIASLTTASVARELPIVLKKNPILEIPLPKDLVADVLNELLTPRELELVARTLLEGFLRAIPRDIESIEQEKYLAYLIPAIVEAPEIRETFEKKDLTNLFRIPGFLEFVMDLVDTFQKQITSVLAGIQTIKAELEKYAQRQPENRNPKEKLPGQLM